MTYINNFIDATFLAPKSRCITKLNSAAHMLLADLQCWFTVKLVKNKYLRFKKKNPSLLVENRVWPRLDIR